MPFMPLPVREQEEFSCRQEVSACGGPHKVRFLNDSMSHGRVFSVILHVLSFLARNVLLDSTLTGEMSQPNVLEGQDMSISAVDRSLTAALNQIYGSAGTGARPAEGTDETPSTGDSVTLSSQAQGLSQLPSLFGVEPGQPITLDDLKAFADEKLKEFAKRFKALLEANGIDTSRPITLGHEYGTGRVIVTSDHPEADKIERLLAKNFDLCNTYTAATSTLEIVKHGEDHSRFAKAYEANPQAAVAQFSYLFNTRWNAEATFTGDEYSVNYSRTPRAQSAVDE